MQVSTIQQYVLISDFLDIPILFCHFSRVGYLMLLAYNLNNCKKSLTSFSVKPFNSLSSKTLVSGVWTYELSSVQQTVTLPTELNILTAGPLFNFFCSRLFSRKYPNANSRGNQLHRLRPLFACYMYHMFCTHTCQFMSTYNTIACVTSKRRRG